MEKWKRKAGGGTKLVEVVERTYHDDPTRLLCRAHAHDGGHANGGALEIHPAEGGKIRDCVVRVAKMEKKTHPSRTFTGTRVGAVIWSIKVMVKLALGTSSTCNSCQFM